MLLLHFAIVVVCFFSQELQVVCCILCFFSELGKSASSIVFVQYEIDLLIWFKSGFCPQHLLHDCTGFTNVCFCFFALFCDFLAFLCQCLLLTERRFNCPSDACSALPFTSTSISRSSLSSTSSTSGASSVSGSTSSSGSYRCRLRLSRLSRHLHPHPE